MIKKVKNEGTVSGKLFGFGRFGLKINENTGKIQGSVVVATDAEESNLVEVHFIPQAEKYKNGKDNNNYKVLKQIIDEEKTIEQVGSNSAISVRITASLTTNPFYIKENGGNEYVLREPMQVKGNFIHIDSKAKPYCGFNVDCLIESMDDKLNSDGTPSNGKKIKVRVFDDYRKEFMPFTMELDSEEGVQYVESNYMAGETYATLSCVVENKTIVSGNDNNTSLGFGEQAVTSQPRKIHRLVIIGADNPKDEFPMNDDEMEECKQNRNTRLAELKNKAIEGASKSNEDVKVGFNTQAKTSIASTSTKKYDF